MSELLKPLTDREPILHCRQYENAYPVENEQVMGTIREVDEIASQLELLEQNGIRAMLLLTEASFKRIRSVKKLLKVGKIEVVTVLRVDENKQCIDLSKKRLLHEEIQECQQKHEKSKKVNSIVRHVAEIMKIDIENIYKVIVWPLQQKYKHPFDAFIKSITDPNEVFGRLNITNDVYSCLTKEINIRLQAPPVRIKAEFELTCFEQEGIEGIKRAFKAGESVNTMSAKFRIIASPAYICEIVTDKKDEGVNCINKILSKIKEEINNVKGEFNMKNQPQVFGEKEQNDINIKKLKNDDSDDDIDIDDEESYEEGINFEIKDNYNSGINSNQNPDDDDFM